MTPKESVKVIFGVLHDDWFSWTPEVVEAFNMAISALKKQEQNSNKCCETCKYKNLPVSENPCDECYLHQTTKITTKRRKTMSDYISRQAAIDAEDSK